MTHSPIRLVIGPMVSLEDHCKRLHDHFSALKSSRNRRTQGPIYVLEHPLSPLECDAVTKQLRSVRKSRGALKEHWLAWLVLATECGYTYSGSQYWPRLEEKIPDWEFSDRYRLTRWFKRFATDFGGASPVGAWAEQFNRIAWPITHAILPSDLQVQLSQAIYAARHYLFGLAERTDEDIGRIVAQRWVPHGDRFERLLQRQQFVGTLVRLLLQRNLVDESISEHALQRIVRDVETHSEARIWLRDAREYCKPTLKIAIPTPTVRTSFDARPLQPRFSPSVVLEPDLQNGWTLWVQPASTISLVAESPPLRKSLEKLRFQVYGNEQQAFPAKDLDRREPRRRPLATLPDPRAPLLRFLPSDDADALLLTQSCLLPARSLWLFKVRVDGTAWLQASSTLTPGSTYLIGTLDPDRTLPGTPTSPPYAGFKLSRLALNDVITAADAETLQQLGFLVKRQATLRPWGILPRLWHDNGQAEYVLGETILFRVERDHDFDGVRVSLDGQAPCEFECAQSGPFLIEIASLELGEHSLVIDTLKSRATKRTTTSIESVASTTLFLHIRVPAVWQPGTVSSEALTISLSPPSATLNALLSGLTILLVDGVANDTLEVKLAITDGASERHEKTILRRKPPITEKDWRERVDAALRDSDMELHALSAIQAHIEILSSHFGWHRAELVVFPKPLRWGADRQGKDLTVQLFSDGDTTPTIQFYSHDAPCNAAEVAFAEVHRGLPARDGLYAARQSKATANLVVSAPPSRMDFSEWRASDSIGITSTDRATLVAVLCLWTNASTVGRLAEVRRGQVVDAIRKQLIYQLAGVRWAAAETRGKLEELDLLVDTQIRNYGIALSHFRGEENIALLHTKFLTTSSRFGITTESWIAEIAWRIVFDPAMLSHDESGTTPFDCSALDHPSLPALVRGARLLELGAHERRSV